MADDNPAASNDPNIHQAGYYPATDHSIPYQSQWSRIHDDEATKATLRHLGCNYMGTEGCPPTLIALKRHAQSMAILIAHLSPSVRTGKVDGNPIFDGRQPAQADGNGLLSYGQTVNGRLELNDAFDWLADLSQPYNNDDPNHHKPLNILSNEVAGQHEVLGTDFHCPLTRVTPREKQEQRGNPYQADVSRTPYANHHLLAMHANACLEHLDHEFSTTGGILSLIPEEGRGANTEELKAAQNSLLGQLLLYVQSLALRNHEQDMTNAKLTDALAGEAVVPMQHLSVLGPDGRSGREIAYPQDRWVLVNAGDDVWAHLHDALDREESALEAREQAWTEGDEGVGGDSVWRNERNDDRHARGVVVVDCGTRFYRLQGQGRSTIFVLPAFTSCPATEWSRSMDRYSKATVVGTVAARSLPRTTNYEKRWNTRYADADRRGADHQQLRVKSQRDEATISNIRAELDRQLIAQRNMAEQLSQYTNRAPGEGEANNRDLIVSLNTQIANLQQAAQQPHHSPPAPGSHIGTPATQFGTPATQFGTPATHFSSPASHFATPPTQFATGAGSAGSGGDAAMSGANGP